MNLFSLWPDHGRIVPLGSATADGRTYFSRHEIMLPFGDDISRLEIKWLPYWGLPAEFCCCHPPPTTRVKTRSSAVAEKPHDARYYFKMLLRV